MGMKKTALIVLGLALVAAGCHQGATNPVLEIGVKGHSNANVSIAASGNVFAIVWGATAPGGMTDIYVAISRDGGRTFGTPAPVSKMDGEASLSGEQPPRIALIPRAGHDPSIVIVWTAKGAAGTRLLSARSDDGGASFAPATVAPGSEAPGNRGWESVASRRDGSILAVWLDHRELSSTGNATGAMNHAAHEHPASGGQQTSGVERAQLSKLFFSTLDGSSNARSIASGVCYCCKTALATGDDGAVYAAWRHVYPGSIRDIAFTVSTDGGETFAEPVRVSEDNWVLDGCPENGPSLAIDARKRVHVVWPTLVPGRTSGSEPTLALFHAMSEDGRTFSSRHPIPTEGFPRHPQIALGPRGELVVVWDEQAPGIKRIALARGTIDEQGSVRFVRQAIGDAAPAVYPVVASTENGTTIVWTSGSAGQTALRVERLSN